MTSLSPNAVAVSDALDGIETTLSGAMDAISGAAGADAATVELFIDTDSVLAQIQQLRTFLTPYRDRLTYVRTIDAPPA